jgi:hypothetical protein
VARHLSMAWGNAAEALGANVVERSRYATVFVQPHLVSIFR